MNGEGDIGGGMEGGREEGLGNSSNRVRCE